jgi:hypothetical protein
MGFLIAAFIVLFLILLLSMPLIVDARMRIGLRGAIIHARIYVFGLIPISVKLRLHLFSKPYFTLRFGKKRVFLLKKKKQTRKRRPVRGVRLLRLDTRTTVGIADEPDKAVLSAGSAAVLLSMLTTRVAESGSARAAIGEPSMLRLSARARAIVYPLKLLGGLLAPMCIARRGSANNSRKSNEKRTEHASC